MSWELLISVISLIISIGSIIYAYFNKKIDLEIISPWYDAKYDSTYISFTLVNSSESSVLINNIVLFKDNEIIKDNGFTPKVNPYDSIHSIRFSDPFEDKEYLAPFETISYAYYIESDKIPNRILITSSKRLTVLRKKKTFLTVFKRN